MGLRFPALGADGPDSLFIPRTLTGVGGSHKFTSANFSYFSNIMRIAAQDMDGDGDQDIVLLSGRRYPYTYASGPSTDMVYTYTTTPQPDRDLGRLATGDYLFGFDGLTATPYRSPNRVAGAIGDPSGRTYAGTNLAWLENDGFGHFALHLIPSNFEMGTDVKVGKLNNDDRFDIAVWAGPETKLLWYQNTLVGGVVTFLEHTVVNGNYWGGGLNGGNGNLISGDIGDIDGDGHNDLITGVIRTGSGCGDANCYDHSSLHYHRGGVDGPEPANGYFNTTVGAGGDEPQAENTSNTRGVWVREAGDFLRVGPVEPNQIIAVDFDNDDTLDIVSPLNEHDYLENRGAITGGPNAGYLRFRKKHIGSTTSTFWRRLAVGDLNNDTRLDVVAANQNLDDGTNRIRAFITTNNNRTNFDEFVFPSGETILGARNPAVGTDPAYLDYLDKFPADVALGDLNNDGFLDVVIGSRSNKFSAPLEARGMDSMVMVYVARHVDRNSDGRISASEMAWDEVPLVEPFVTENRECATNMSLAIADFDGDGDLDIVRSSRVAPLIFFENVWNTQRRVRVETEVRTRSFNKKSTDYLIVDPPSAGNPTPIGRSSGKAEGSP